MLLRKLGWVACALCLVSLGILCTAARAGEKAAEPKVVDEAWYDAVDNSKNDQVIARSHDITEQAEYKGQPAIHQVEELTLLDEMGNNEFNQTIRTETWTTTDGRLLKLEYAENMKTGKTTVTAEVAGAKLTAKKTAGGETETKEIDIPEGTIVYADVPESLCKLLGVNKGDKRGFVVFSPNSMGLETETITVLGTRKYTYGGKEIEALVYQEVDSDKLDVRIEITMSPDFKLLQATNGVIKIVRIVKPAPAEPAAK